MVIKEEREDELTIRLRGYRSTCGQHCGGVQDGRERQRWRQHEEDARQHLQQEVTEIWIGPTSDVAWPADGLACPDSQSIALTAFNLSPLARRAASAQVAALLDARRYCQTCIHFKDST